MQYQLCRTGLMQSVFALLFLLPLSLSMASCSDDAPVNPTPDPPVETSSSYILKSQDITELKGKEQNQEVKAMLTENAKNYFGERFKLCQPEKILITKDFAIFSMSGDLSQDYMIKWDNDKLYLYNDANDSWNYCGAKDGEKIFVLNCGFYRINKITSFGNLSTTGQSYSLSSYTDLIDFLGGSSVNASSQIVWLKVEYKFEKATNTNL